MFVNLCKNVVAFVTIYGPQKHYNEQMPHIPQSLLEEERHKFVCRLGNFLPNDYSINEGLMNFNGNNFRILNTETQQDLYSYKMSPATSREKLLIVHVTLY